jgi:hypothetical protein
MTWITVARNVSEPLTRHNLPAAFDDLSAAEQDALRMWIRLALEPARLWSAAQDRWHSYNLKHHAEAALGWYVGNGAMKGAMLAEGYRDYRSWGDATHPDINWTFRVQPRCPHLVYGRRFRCPMAGQYTMYPDDPHMSYPSLCQATPEELTEFDRLRLLADAA